MGGDGSGIPPVWLALAVCGLIALFVVFAPSETTDRPQSPAEPGRGTAPAAAQGDGAKTTRLVFAGRIEGRVTRGGKGIEAEISLHLHPELNGTDRRPGTADADGSFVFESIPPGEHVIVATDAAGTGVRKKVKVCARVDRTQVEVVLPDGDLMLRGRAVHADERPFLGELRLLRGIGHDSLTTATDGEGRFLFTGLSKGQAYFRIRSRDRFYAEGPTVNLPHAGEFLIVVDAGTEIVRGRVVSRVTGSPIAGAVVCVSGNTPSGPCLSYRTKTDANGGFRATAPIRDGRIGSLEVEAEGFKPWNMNGIARRDLIEIRLDPSARLTVRLVTAEGGNPAPLVPVTASYDQRPNVKEAETVLTGADGRASFASIPGGTVRLFVCGHGFFFDPDDVTKERLFLFLEPGEKREVELEVHRAALIHGRVTTASGEPVDGGQVQLVMEGSRHGRNIEPGGRFAHENLASGEFTIRAKRQDLIGEFVRGILSPGDVRRIDLSLPPGAWIEVEVRARDTGEALDGARVDLRGMHDAGHGLGYTDSNGTLKLGPFKPEPRYVEAHRRGYLAARSENIEFQAGQTSSATLLLDRGLSISGRAVRTDGKPAPAADVAWFGGGRWPRRQTTKADENGRFELWGLPTGNLELYAGWRDGAERKFECRRTVPAGRGGVILKLQVKKEEPRQHIVVSVTDPSGKPVPVANVDAQFRAEDGSEARHDQYDVVEGHARIEVHAGESQVLLWVNSARLPNDDPLPLGAATFGPFPTDGGPISVALPEERVITGKVVDPKGRGVPRLFIETSVRPWPGADPMSRYPWDVWTRPDGSFRIAGLGAGTVELDVYPPDGLVSPYPFRVPAGTEGVVIKLDTLVEAVVTVRDAEGRAIEGASIRLWDEARLTSEGNRDAWEIYHEAETDQKGQARFEELPASASWRLAVVPERTEANLGAKRIDAWKAVDTDIVLRPGKAISGKAIMPDGEPYPDEEGQIWVWSRGRRWETLYVDSEGTFEKRGLAKGRVALVWIPPEGDPYDDPIVDPEDLKWPVTWIEAGAKDIIFRIR